MKSFIAEETEIVLFPFSTETRIENSDSQMPYEIKYYRATVCTCLVKN
jgi:hypothetical protein